MTVFTIHGVVDSWQKDKHIYRSYIGKKSFKNYLINRKTKFQKWNGIKTVGDVLTIDDSTLAGAEACILARELGHEVIFFINPKQIINSEIYWFSILNTIIDNKQVNGIHFQNEKFELTNPQEIKHFRNKIKNILCKETPSSINLVLEELKTKLKTSNSELPLHVRAITINELMELKKMNIIIESHGWDHQEIKYLNDIEIIKSMEQIRDWIKQTLNTNSSLYAVPNGETDLSVEVRNKINGDYFLATDKLPLGQIHTNCWNRLEITNELQKS